MAQHACVNGGTSRWSDVLLVVVVLVRLVIAFRSSWPLTVGTTCSGWGYRVCNNHEWQGRVGGCTECENKHLRVVHEVACVVTTTDGILRAIL
jgi:hypothetical protein